VELLRLNVALNGLQSVIHISNLALADAPAEYFVVGNRAANSGAGYLVSGRPPQPTHRRRSSDKEAIGGTGPVAAVSLDGFLADVSSPRSPVSLIKIDVEGMEESVIAGATETIESDRPVVYFEVAAEQARRSGLPDLAHLDYLHGLGYRFVRNVAARNAADDDFRLEVVEERNLAELIEANDVTDLAAIPQETSLEALS